MSKAQTTKSDAVDVFTPTNCVSYRLRRAARLAAKKYDAALRPTGLRNTQFTLLGALNHLGPTSVGDLSDALAMDQTTVTRNLAILARKNFVEELPNEDGRVHLACLSDEGAKIYNRALPLWQGSQKLVLAALDDDLWPLMMGNLQQIENACANTG